MSENKNSNEMKKETTEERFKRLSVKRIRAHQYIILERTMRENEGSGYLIAS